MLFCCRNCFREEEILLDRSPRCLVCGVEMIPATDYSRVWLSPHAAILLMPPQVQLGGTIKSGRIVKHDRWAAAEQLAIIDFRLNHRRLGTGSRADGVVVFERPPYKQSNEQLFLQMADSGAVDRPALAPIGFGVNSLRQEEDHGITDGKN